MNTSVIIKSTKYGILLLLDESIDFETLVKDICTKFAESRKFWGNVHLIITIKGRELTPEETSCVVEAIELNSDIKIILIEEDDVIKDIRMKDKIDKYYYDEIYANAKIIKGSIKKNAIIKSDNSIVILGDVKKGAKVEAAGNVIVVGCLEGEAYAGYPEDKSMFIVASEFASDIVTIGGVVGKPMMHKKWSFRVSKQEKEPLGVVVWNNNELLIEPIKSGILKNIRQV
ncbi:MAG: hypothetical protein K5644_06990 [Lachnospiraceae bacterium]|nr:hypothetical protein [Lachnospiraceae bacterium]